MAEHSQGEWEVIAPVPADALAPPRAHPTSGTPQAVWTYRDAAGAILGHVWRFNRPDGKFFLPLTYCRHTGHGRKEWRFKAWKPPRPLYGLDRLAARPEAQVLVTEGEKAADAAAKLLGDWVVVSAPNGSNAAAKVDWGPLAGRRVVVWPDADEPGRGYANDVGRALAAAGADTVTVINPPAKVKAGWDAADALDDGWDTKQTLALVEDARPLAEAPQPAHGSSPRTRPDSVGNQKQPRRGRGDGAPPQRNGLVKLASDLDLWHTPDRECYATVPVGGHFENWLVRSKEFRRWLAGRHYDETGGAPGSQGMEDAIRVIEMLALRGPERLPYLRVGEIDGKIYLDLGDDTWRAVEVTAKGWRVVAIPPVKFMRSSAMKPLPEPAGGESINKLREFVNVAHDEDFRLIVAFLVAALRPGGPYPILLVSGEQGTAKTTLCRTLAGLVDPRTAAIRSLPREERDLVIAAYNGHLLGFDNVSGLPNWMSDALCRLASGGGFAARELHSDRDEVIFDARRPIMLNGIPDLANRPDLGDRALAITLTPIPAEQRRTERELQAAFKKAQPEILGALLDAVSAALRNQETVELDSYERMADFCLWVTAAEEGLGWEKGSFMEAYRANRAGAVALAIESDPVASAMVKMGEQGGLPWEGSASELLPEIETGVPEKVRTSRAWPSTPSALSNRLRRAATLLRQFGLEVKIGIRAPTKDRKRLIEIRRLG